MSDRINITNADLEPSKPRLEVTPEDVADFPVEAATGKVNLMQRAFGKAEQILAQNPEDGKWSQRFKRGIANNVLAMRDQEFNSTLAQTLGGSAVAYAGLALTLHPNQGMQVAGAALVAAGAAKQVEAGQRHFARYQDLAQ